MHTHKTSISCCPECAVQTNIVWLEIALTLMGGILVFNSYLAQYVFALGDMTSGISAIIGSVLLSIPIFWNAIKNILEGTMHMSELVALAILGCFALGDFRTAGVVAFLLLFSELILTRTAIGARSSIEKLMHLTPSVAHLMQDGIEKDIPSSDIMPFHRIRIRPGEAIPADGKVIAGHSTVQEASVTGEAIPQDKTIGDNVFAGTINLNGVLEVEVTKSGSDTTLGKVQKLITDAEATKTPIMRIIDRYSVWYVPTVLMIAGLILFFTGDATRAIAAVVIACPCAFILATPTAFVSALSSAARLGILIKDVNLLESSANISCVVFDKTGTVTTGDITVSKIRTKDISEDELLRYVSSVEQHSNHPVAKAVVGFAKRKGIQTFLNANSIHETAGKGIRAVVEGKMVNIGRYQWLERQGCAGLERAEDDSGLYVSLNNRFAGVLSIEDKTREEAKQATQHLKAMGCKRVFLLTGDKWKRAKNVSDELGCTDVEAECLPEHKLDIVYSLKQKYTVAVVGDGINDAPALAAGDVGIAMGAAGSDLAMDSAGVALMNNDLNRLPNLISLSRDSGSVIKQNLIFGVFLVVAGLVLSGLGFLNPVVAAILHTASSVVVIFNSARLMRFGEKVTSNI
jgi:Cd2+/Zn2+-exporting ATPase